jgi:hypothetical protein
LGKDKNKDKDKCNVRIRIRLDEIIIRIKMSIRER